jgi:hypothetical protein
VPHRNGDAERVRLCHAGLDLADAELVLATRLATLPFLARIVVIQTFVYPNAWTELLTWASILLMLLTRGLARCRSISDRTPLRGVAMARHMSDPSPRRLLGVYDGRAQ